MAAPKAAPETTDVVKAFKGFTTDLTCNGFQFAEGGEYEVTGPARLCAHGFHACESPLDVFSYYPPGTSVYREVELTEVAYKREGDSKLAGRKIKIGASVSLAGMASAHVEFVHEHIIKDAKKSAHREDDRSAATNTGDRSAATNTGYRSAATNTGYQSAATNTGYQSAATNTGYQSAATNTGDRSAATVEGAESVAIVTGYDGRVSGALGCWLVLTERDNYYKILGVQAVKVDGKKVLPDTFYALRGGKVVTA